MIKDDFKKIISVKTNIRFLLAARCLMPLHVTLIFILLAIYYVIVYYVILSVDTSCLARLFWPAVF